MKNFVKKSVVKAAEKTVFVLAETFANSLCGGKIYEPKVPKKLQK